MRRAAVLGALVALLPMTGCGTVMGWAEEGRPRPYIGTIVDTYVCWGLDEFAYAAFGVVDLPFSFVFDTLLLPVSLPLSLAR
jgi:uncharacterized protein YceK